MAPPQPSPNAPLVVPSLPNAAELKMAAQSVSDSLTGTVGGPRHAPAFLFIVLVLGLVSWYARRVRGQKSQNSPKFQRSEKTFEIVGRQWTKQKMRAD
ncbi:hypothetical protein VTL71DRAFT_1985 [Oculimacula yallundae]|uniref:Uncharacterized protein n=1 Tax=Oculimacula yallundae TaxID=86028 RepID=A0ABR4CCA9_9HELO